MKVSVFGAGYVGLVQAAVLAEVGNDVICVDVDAEKVERLTKGEIPIYEPGLTPIILDTVKSGNLTFTTDAKHAVDFADVIFIAVGTPPDEDGSADLQYVLAVANTIGNYAEEPKVVVTKSTVPVGTSDLVSEALESAHRNKHPDYVPPFFSVISNPEFLKEGSAVSDCKRPDRIIIGGDNAVAIETMKELYAPFGRNHDKIITMDIRSAELTKYAANCMLATKISFMNEMAGIAEQLGADIESVRVGIGADQRIGYQFLYPGCGYGGSCFPKDVKALIQTSEENGAGNSVLKAVEHVNAQQKEKINEYVGEYYGLDDQDSSTSLEGKVFALWGLSFKPNTDDMREAPSINVIKYLTSRGAKVQAFDPEAMAESKRIFGELPGLSYMDNKNECLAGADALVLCTEWEVFRSPDFNDLRLALRDRVIFDGRNQYDPERVEKAGISYFGIGRGRSVQIQ